MSSERVATRVLDGDPPPPTSGITQDFLELRDELRPVLGRKLVQIDLLPAHRRQLRRARDAQQAPIRLAALKPYEEILMSLRHFSRDLGDQRFSGFEQLVQTYFIGAHALEAVRELVLDILATRNHDLGNRPVMADEVDDECLAEIVRDAFVGEQIADIEQVARMLPVERREIRVLKILLESERNARREEEARHTRTIEALQREIEIASRGLTDRGAEGVRPSRTVGAPEPRSRTRS